jgi:hypothetical protein
VNGYISKWTSACLLVVVINLPQPVWAEFDGVIAQHCSPLGLLPAVVQGVIDTESGGHALAIGVQFQGVHRGYFPRDPAGARALLDRVLQDTDNVGIGLMQINWRAWKDRLHVSPQQLLDPAVNLRVGCRILQQALIRHGVQAGIGAYHSPTPWRQAAYGRRVQRAIRKGAGR